MEQKKEKRHNGMLEEKNRKKIKYVSKSVSLPSEKWEKLEEIAKR